MSKLRNVAEQLLDILRVEKTDRVVDGVLSVLESIRDSVNEQWEEYVRKRSDEALAEYNVKCKKCNTPVTLERYRSAVIVKPTKH